MSRIRGRASKTLPSRIDDSSTESGASDFFVWLASPANASTADARSRFFQFTNAVARNTTPAETLTTLPRQEKLLSSSEGNPEPFWARQYNERHPSDVKPHAKANKLTLADRYFRSLAMVFRVDCRCAPHGFVSVKSDILPTHRYPRAWALSRQLAMIVRRPQQRQLQTIYCSPIVPQRIVLAFLGKIKSRMIARSVPKEI